jgi:hypothetical protein
LRSEFSAALKKRLAGILLLALGAFALSAPLTTGRWSLAILGIPLIALSIAEAYAAFRSARRAELRSYLPSVLAMLAGNLLLLSSALFLGGLLILLVVILVADGLGKILTIAREPQPARIPQLVNGFIDLGCVALLWYLSRLIGTEQAIGFVIGAYIAAAGWRMLMAPVEVSTPEAAVAARNAHPDNRLNIAPNETFARLRAEIRSAWRTARVIDLMWMLTLVFVFLAIHAGRMPIADSLLGFISPAVATAGDLLMTLVLAMLLILPARLLLRRLTRPIERLAWSLHLGAEGGSTALNRVADRLAGGWLEGRFGFSMRLREARVSLAVALLFLLRLGLPMTAFFVAFNPIWGFTWYFNTESWATGIYQKMTEMRVDPWRRRMIDAVDRNYGGEGDTVFRIDPPGVQGSGDFSFLVIGDPGEGDASQFSLTSRYLKLGLNDDVKFLVISSDVI